MSPTFLSCVLAAVAALPIPGSAAPFMLQACRNFTNNGRAETKTVLESPAYIEWWLSNRPDQDLMAGTDTFLAECVTHVLVAPSSANERVVVETLRSIQLVHGHMSLHQHDALLFAVGAMRGLSDGSDKRTVYLLAAMRPSSTDYQLHELCLFDLLRDVRSANDDDYLPLVAVK